MGRTPPEDAGGSGAHHRPPVGHGRSALPLSDTEIALAVIMEAGACGVDEARQVLVEVSERTHVSPQELARRLAAALHGPAPSKPLRDALRIALHRVRKHPDAPLAAPAAEPA